MDYAVKGGDTLSAIAQKALGDANRWPEIYAANRDAMDHAFERARPTLRKIGSAAIRHPSDYLVAGQILNLPAASSPPPRPSRPRATPEPGAH